MDRSVLDELTTRLQSAISTSDRLVLLVETSSQRVRQLVEEIRVCLGEARTIVDAASKDMQDEVFKRIVGSLRAAAPRKARRRRGRRS